MTTAVDVIIAAYNAEPTIRAAVASAQQVHGAAVTVVDDGSADGTADIARSLGATVIEQQNSGASAARSRGLAASTAPLVVFLDADDELVAHGVHRSIALLEDSPRAVVSAGRVEGFTAAAATVGVLPRRYDSVTTTSLIRTGFGPWPPAASVIRRAALVEAADLEPSALSTRYAEDYEMIIRLSLLGDVAMHDAVAMRYRMYDGKSSNAAESALRDKERIRRHYADALRIEADLMDERQLRAATRIRMARVALSRKRYINALALVARVIVTNPMFILRKVMR